MKKKQKKVKDFSEILRPYENMWVALTKDNTRVVEADKTLELLITKLKGKDYRKFEFMKVPQFDIYYAPFFE